MNVIPKKSFRYYNLKSLIFFDVDIFSGLDWPLLGFNKGDWSFSSWWIDDSCKKNCISNLENINDVITMFKMLSKCILKNDRRVSLRKYK